VEEAAEMGVAPLAAVVMAAAVRAEVWVEVRRAMEGMMAVAKPAAARVAKVVVAKVVEAKAVGVVVMEAVAVVMEAVAVVEAPSRADRAEVLRASLSKAS